VARANGRTAREVTISRIIDAPRGAVFKAWTDGRRVAQWWGPHRFTNPVCEIDARRGGDLYIVIRAPDGREHRVRGIFREVAAPERLVFTNTPLNEAGRPVLDGLTTVTFADDNGRTKVTAYTRAVALTAAAQGMLAVMEAGWSETIERLGAYAAQSAH